MSRDVVMIPTGAANIASVLAAFTRMECKVRFVESAKDIENGTHVILPGVGSFGAAIKRLNELGIVDSLRQRIDDGRPTLAVCLGLQLLADRSEESPDVNGLGCIPQTVRRFTKAPRIPQFGWNEIAVNGDARYLESGHTYFANSYCLMEAPDGWSVAWSEFGERYVAAMERKGVLACQFHPELSGKLGASILRRWLEQEVTV